MLADSAAIEKLCSNYDINEDEMASLVDLAIAQMVRTPSCLAEQNGVLANSFISTVGETHQEIVGRAKAESLALPRHEVGIIDDPGSSLPFPPLPIEVTIDEDRNAITSELPIGQRSFLYAMGRGDGPIRVVFHFVDVHRLRREQLSYPKLFTNFATWENANFEMIWVR